ncbi:MAG: hypothetical protein GQ582_06755 [Methyloprofundus sp.]|nr:hypothetical protein [Methyloprofundus sp.]
MKKQKGGVRNAEKKYQSIKNLVSSEKLLNRARNYLLNDPKVVRVIYFDKTIENNWLVTWHQDRTVAVTERFELEGWGSWSVKDGTHHVQPPLEVLNNMITFRVHLDAANEKNGCLKIMPCSHKLGILSQAEINQYCNNHTSINCIVNKGDTLIMRPHLLHSSSKAVNPTNRRVVHIEFSGFCLPEGILWA